MIRALDTESRIKDEYAAVTCVPRKSVRLRKSTQHTHSREKTQQECHFR